MAAEDMSNVAVAAISLLGTLAGTGSSIIMANRLISYRITKLEEMVQARSTAIERTYQLDKDLAVTREYVREIDHRLEAVERSMKK